MKVIGEIEEKKKARLDNMARWIEYFFFKSKAPGRMSWALTWLFKYHKALDEGVKGN